MKRIRKRQRPDRLPTEARKSGGTLGRRVYYFILLLCVVATVNYFFGDKFLLRSEGVIKHDMVTLEAPATMLVAEVLVRPGQAVHKGDPLMRLEAVESRLQLSLLAERLAALKDTQYQRMLDARRARDQMPLLRQQIAAREGQLEALSTLQGRGLYRRSEIDDIMVELLDFRRQFADLEARAAAVFTSEHETALLEENLINLSDLVGDGILRAPISGKIGQDVICVGAVATTGERLASILHGEYYLVAYLDSEYFFDIGPGTQVKITGHRKSTDGVVQEILPYSEARPIEFHNSLRPRGRDLLARILIDDPEGFVMDQGVKVTLEPPGWKWAVQLTERILKGVSNGPEQYAQQ